jgi:predicted phage replisome organizer
MADVKWIKITTDIFDDEKILLIESLPDAYAIITVWFKLLCLAGKQNNSGVFMMNNRVAYTDKMLATIFRMKESTVTLALQTFEQFGMVEIIDGVITIPNWGKHQNLDQLESKKEYMRNYMKEYREKQKLLTGKTFCKTNGKANVSEADKDIDKEKKEKKKKEIKVFSDDAELNQAILAFMEFRKSIKKPMTDRAVELLINKLNGMTSYIPEQIEIINQSIVNGWQGVFPLKNDQAQTVRQTYHKQTKAEELDQFYAMAVQFGEGD